VERLEAVLAMLPAPEADGAGRRLALLEVEAMLWAQGLTLRCDGIGRDLMDAQAGSDPEAMRLARWAVRRLDGQGVLADLPAFLGLHCRDDMPEGAWPGVACAFRDRTSTPPQRRSPGRSGASMVFIPSPGGQALLALWRMAGLSRRTTRSSLPSGRPEHGGGRRGAALRAPRPARAAGLDRPWSFGGSAGGPSGCRASWGLGGAQPDPADQGLGTQARAATAGVKGANAARVNGVLAARPLISTMEVETLAGISRPTAARMLTRLSHLGLIREVTGRRRFRLWVASV